MLDFINSMELDNPPLPKSTVNDRNFNEHVEHAKQQQLNQHTPPKIRRSSNKGLSSTTTATNLLLVNITIWRNMELYTLILKIYASWRIEFNMTRLLGLTFYTTTLNVLIIYGRVERHSSPEELDHGLAIYRVKRFTDTRNIVQRKTRCPEGWLDAPYSCFQYFNTPMTFSDAVKFCTSKHKAASIGRIQNSGDIEFLNKLNYGDTHNRKDEENIIFSMECTFFKDGKFIHQNNVTTRGFNCKDELPFYCSLTKYECPPFYRLWGVYCYAVLNSIQIPYEMVPRVASKYMEDILRVYIPKRLSKKACRVHITHKPYDQFEFRDNNCSGYIDYYLFANQHTPWILHPNCETIFAIPNISWIEDQKNWKMLLHISKWNLNMVKCKGNLYKSRWSLGNNTKFHTTIIDGDIVGRSDHDHYRMDSNVNIYRLRRISVHGLMLIVLIKRDSYARKKAWHLNPINLFQKNFIRNDRCPSLWVYHKGICYYIQETKNTFYEANKFCSILGGYLVEIDTKEQNLFLSDYILKYFKGNIQFSWIGLNSLKSYNEFRNEHTGTNPRNVSWELGYPHDSMNKKCVYIQHENGTWKNVECKHKMSTICQRVFSDSLQYKTTFGNCRKGSQKEFCINRGGSVLRIETRYTTMVINRLTQMSYVTYYIGLVYNKNIGNWTWNNGFFVNSNPCVIGGYGVKGLGTWRIVDCKEPHYVICQFNPETRKIGNKCYAFNEDKKTFAEAQKKCRENNDGYLASFQNFPQAINVLKMMSLHSSSHEILIGLRKSPINGDYINDNPFVLYDGSFDDTSYCFCLRNNLLIGSNSKGMTYDFIPFTGNIKPVDDPSEPDLKPSANIVLHRAQTNMNDLIFLDSWFTLLSLEDHLASRDRCGGVERFTDSLNHRIDTGSEPGACFLQKRRWELDKYSVDGGDSDGYRVVGVQWIQVEEGELREGYKVVALLLKPSLKLFEVVAGNSVLRTTSGLPLS
ncbi:MRC [Lepeophtheirus salmonis]|uniref:MRC n=1 Tax=Lepeophtheirus salmonis TaxID=72036 RepID=A0A7R8CF53_LEPSM|nr:MRC [Lepeophtheirus salmonis]CAF2797781.1 MRC [Lepeophtheirus salmonis]